MLYEETERARLELEERLIPEVEALFAEQGERILRAVEEGGGASGDAELVADDDAFAFEVLTLIWYSAAPAFAAATYEGLSTDAAKRLPTGPEWLDRVIAFLRLHGGVMVRSITDTVRADLVRVLSAGVAEGEGVPQLARRVREAWPEITRRRAVRIVRTEVIAASNYGAAEGARQAAADFGLRLRKEWIATRDARTRDSHRALDGRVVGMDEAFDVGGYAGQYPGDPALPAAERVNCRCALAHVPEREAKSWRDERDARIRERYPALKAQWGQAQAIADLAEAESLSERQVRRILYEGGR